MGGVLGSRQNGGCASLCLAAQGHSKPSLKRFLALAETTFYIIFSSWSRQSLIQSNIGTLALQRQGTVGGMLLAPEESARPAKVEVFPACSASKAAASGLRRVLPGSTACPVWTHLLTQHKLPAMTPKPVFELTSRKTQRYMRPSGFSLQRRQSLQGIFSLPSFSRFAFES